MFSTEHPVVTHPGAVPPGAASLLQGLYGAGGRADSAFHVPVCCPPGMHPPGEGLGVSAGGYSGGLTAALHSVAGLPRPTPTFPLLDPASYLQGAFTARYPFSSPYLMPQTPAFPPLAPLPPDHLKSARDPPPLPPPSAASVQAQLSALAGLQARGPPGVDPPPSPSSRLPPAPLPPPAGSSSSPGRSSTTPSPPPGSNPPHPFAAFLTARECPWFAFPYHQDIFR